MKETTRLRILVVILIIAIGIIVYGVVLMTNNLMKNNEIQDIANLTSLIIEVGIGIIITATVYIYSDKQQKELTSLVTKIDQQQSNISKIISDIKEIEIKQQNIIEEQGKISKKWQDYFLNSVISDFEFCEDNLNKIRRNKNDLESGGYTSDDERDWLRRIGNHVYELQDSFQDVSNIINTSSQHLDPSDVDEIKKTVKHGLEFCEMDFGYPNDIPDPQKLLNEVQTLLGKISV